MYFKSVEPNLTPRVCYGSIYIQGGLKGQSSGIDSCGDLLIPNLIPRVSQGSIYSQGGLKGQSSGIDSCGDLLIPNLIPRVSQGIPGYPRVLYVAQET